MDLHTSPLTKANWVVAILLAYLVGSTYFGILSENQGTFSYIVDDAYIHLSFAYHLAHHHLHSSSLSGFSAPSSSIIWPLLLLPFTWLPPKLFAMIPLLLNLISALGLILVFHHFFIHLIAPQTATRTENLVPYLFGLVGLLFLSNNLAMIFTGMEHVIHPMINFLVAYAVIDLHQNKTLQPWMWLVVIAAPFFRFESLAMSGCVGLLLIKQKKFNDALKLGLWVGLPLLSYAWFLHHHHSALWLPGSVLAKQSFARVWATTHISDRFIVAPFPFICAALSIHLIYKKPQERPIAIGMVLVLLAEQISGLNLYFRYHPGFYAFYWPLLLYCYRTRLTTAHPFRGSLLFLTSVLYLALPLLYKPSDIITASNNIFAQQFQMRRFVRQYYPTPVLANDVGWLSYMNPYPVYDLIGLSQPDMMGTINLPQNQRNQKLNHLTKTKDISLVMMYPLFAYPNQWQHIATLTYKGTRVAISDIHVLFLTTKKTVSHALRAALMKFQKTLPPQAYLTFTTPPEQPAHAQQTRPQ